MEVKTGYKQTEVGVIPEDWAVKPLGTVLSKGRLGGNYPNQDREAEHPLMKMGNLARGYIDATKVEYVTPGVTPESQHKLAYGDILFNTRNTLDLVGKVAIWRDELPTAYYNSNLMRLEFDPQQVCSNEYANYSLNTTASVVSLRALATGTTSVAAIYRRDLLKLPFVVPPFPEQHAIAGALSDVDALIGALDQLIAKKLDLKQASMQRLLTGQKRLPGFHGQWELKRFGEAAMPRKERVDPRRGDIQDFCVELEHIEPATGNLLGSTSTGETSSLKSVFRKGDVLFGKLRAYLRKFWFANRPGVCSTEIWVFFPNAKLIKAEYLFQLIKVDQFIETASTAYGTHMPRSDWNIVKSYELRIPPLPEQTAIAEVLSDMDAELAALEQRREKTRALKQGMMQELLTGRVRLVDR